tara:strand:- start:44329 stop:44802 length:474 start_codon:yes stop_codon:yes gene_type:complete
MKHLRKFNESDDNIDDINDINDGDIIDIDDIDDNDEKPPYVNKNLGIHRFIKDNAKRNREYYNNEFYKKLNLFNESYPGDEPLSDDTQFLLKYAKHYGKNISDITKINTSEGERLGFILVQMKSILEDELSKVFWDEGSQTVCIEKDGEISEAPYID